MFFSAASLMLYAKSHMLPEGSEGEFYYGEDAVIIEKTMLDNLTVSDIEMGDNFIYFMDPTRTDVTIKGDSAFISKLTIEHEDQFRILTGGLGRSFEWPENLKVVIGVKNLDGLDLDINGNASVTTTDDLEYDSVKINMQGNARFIVDLTVNKLDVRSNGNSRLTLNGTSNYLTANSNGNSRLNFESCGLGSTNLDLNGNAKFYGGTTENLDGHANGNAKITFNEITGKQNTSANGNGRFTIRN